MREQHRELNRAETTKVETKEQKRSKKRNGLKWEHTEMKKGQRLEQYVTSVATIQAGIVHVLYQCYTLTEFNV